MRQEIGGAYRMYGKLGVKKQPGAGALFSLLAQKVTSFDSYMTGTKRFRVKLFVILQFGINSTILWSMFRDSAKVHLFCFPESETKIIPSGSS